MGVFSSEERVRPCAELVNSATSTFGNERDSLALRGFFGSGAGEDAASLSCEGEAGVSTGGCRLRLPALEEDGSAFDSIFQVLVRFSSQLDCNCREGKTYKEMKSEWKGKAGERFLIRQPP